VHIAPVVEIAVIAAEPHQGDEVNLLVYVQASNKAGKLRAIGVPCSYLKHIVARIGDSVTNPWDWRNFATMKNTFSGEIERFGTFRIADPS